MLHDTRKECSRSNVVYKFSGGCGETYIGSTGRTLHQRSREHLQGVHEVGVVASGHDVVDIRMKEAIMIDEERPTLNGRNELCAWV